VLFKTKRTGALMYVMPLAALINIGANIVLVPRHGLVGAAVATLLGYLVTAVVTMWAARQAHHVEWDRRSNGLAWLVAAVGVTAALLLPVDGPVLVLRCVLAVAAGLAVLVPLVRSGRMQPDGPLLGTAT
jgi:Na+-driven multidrug efflux pump